MSLNPKFDEVLALVFGTLDRVHQIHEPEDEDGDYPGNCTNCGVAFPCETQDAIMNGLAHIKIAMRGEVAEEEAPVVESEA